MSLAGMFLLMSDQVGVSDLAFIFVARDSRAEVDVDVRLKAPLLSLTSARPRVKEVSPVTKVSGHDFLVAFVVVVLLLFCCCLFGEGGGTVSE